MRSFPGGPGPIEQALSRMQPQTIVLHERLAHWSRQIRPRLRGWPIRWSETRSTSELVRAASRASCPILVIDLADRPRQGLEDLDAGLTAAPSALSLVLDPLAHEDLPMRARELGATAVLTGLAVPPSVIALLQRWLPIARQRSEAGGWSVPVGPEPFIALGPSSTD